MDADSSCPPGSPGTVAVLVLSHRFPSLVNRLVARLADGTNTVAAVHHDPTGEPLTLRRSSSAVLIPDPVACPWGRLGIVEALRRSLSWLRGNVTDLSWVLVISGQDYPVRGVRAIEAELAATRDDAFMRYFQADGDPAADVHPWQAVTRRRYLRKRRLPLTARSVALPWPRRHPYRDGTHLYVGDVWVNLSGPAVYKILESPLADKLMRYLRFATSPDETYVQTLALNGTPELSVVNDTRRYIRWPDDARHPAFLGPDDVPGLRESDAFFARKIDPRTGPRMCDLLDDLARERDGRC